MGKGPTYGEFTFPKSATSFVRGYARGGMVNGQKPAPVMKERATDVGALAKAGALGGLGGSAIGGLSGLAKRAKPQEMKVGGSVKRASMNLSPKARTDAPPKSVNVKARMSLGAAGSPESLKRGGMVHPDAKQDKTMIKKAVGMHDTQLHGGKHTNLTKLRSGGMAKAKTYAKGGAVKFAGGGAVESSSKANSSWGSPDKTSKMEKTLKGYKAGGAVKKGGMCK